MMTCENCADCKNIPIRTLHCFKLVTVYLNWQFGARNTTELRHVVSIHECCKIGLECLIYFLYSNSKFHQQLLLTQASFPAWHLELIMTRQE